MSASTERALGGVVAGCASRMRPPFLFNLERRVAIVLRRTLLTSLALGGLATAVAVQPAQASEELTSSMLATCIGAGGSCQQIEFLLDVEGPATYYVRSIDIFGGASGTWAFGSVDSVWANGGLVSWVQTSSAGSMALTLSDNASPPFDPDPIRIRVTMADWGSPGQLALMSYSANGYGVPSPTDNSTLFSTGGTVTPEPLTTLLLGTGLAGLAGVSRRKKALLENEEDVS